MPIVEILTELPDELVYEVKIHSSPVDVACTITKKCCVFYERSRNERPNKSDTSRYDLETRVYLSNHYKLS